MGNRIPRYGACLYSCLHTLKPEPLALCPNPTGYSHIPVLAHEVYCVTSSAV